jgi:acetylornithine/succinyldiaminopimelate/putrescine aminotransferase
VRRTDARLELRVDARRSSTWPREGLLVNRTAEKVVAMLPPLNITTGEIDKAIDILDGVLASVSAEVHA